MLARNGLKYVYQREDMHGKLQPHDLILSAHLLCTSLAVEPWRSSEGENANFWEEAQPPRICSYNNTEGCTEHFLSKEHKPKQYLHDLYGLALTELNSVVQSVCMVFKTSSYHYCSV